MPNVFVMVLAMPKVIMLNVFMMIVAMPNVVILLVVIPNGVKVSAMLPFHLKGIFLSACMLVLHVFFAHGNKNKLFLEKCNKVLHYKTFLQL
jgi:hypothetical protein